MRYFGGKQRIATALVNELIQPLLDSGVYNRYVEPFAGSCNVISKVRYGDRIVWKRQAKQDMKSANGKRKETVEVVIRFN